MLGMEFYRNDSNISSTYIRFTGRALGFPDTEGGLPASTVTNILENTRDIHTKRDSTHVPSMLLDVERGQPIEVEVILGEVVRMAKERDVDVPVSIAVADNVPID